MATIAILGLAGLAQAVLPLACTTGALFCGEAGAVAPVDPALALDDQLAEATPAPSLPPSPEQPSLVVSTPSIAVAPVAVAALPQAPVAGQQDLIAATFEVLDAELTLVAGPLESRKVRTVAIGPDGSPVTDPVPAPDLLVAEASAESGVSDVPSGQAASVLEQAEPSMEPSAEEPSAGPSAEPSEAPSSEPVVEEPATSMAYAPASGDSATVTGKGANVRSQPRRSEVLFALNGGEAVTIVEMSKGWARVVDARGRSGWIYGDYLRRE